ncbi:MAG: M20/M25/M40 family metallo-hydrolase, partial [Alphaproteobacteria bacterium]|nr:M20/M25/M40 family metallo-hydrolase [Alphaproteobacteria bacterium]
FEAPPYTTIQHGLIHGCTAVNIVASACSFDFDIRYLPGVDPLAIVQEVQDFVAAKVLPEMHAVWKDTGFTWEMVPGREALDTDEDAEIIAVAKDLSRTNSTYRVGFGTEAGYFQKAGIPTVVCGPGSIDQAHKPDEFVTIEQVARCEAFIRRLMDLVCAS